MIPITGAVIGVTSNTIVKITRILIIKMHMELSYGHSPHCLTSPTMMIEDKWLGGWQHYPNTSTVVMSTTVVMLVSLQ